MIPAWILDSAAVLVLAAAALSFVRLLLRGPSQDGPAEAAITDVACVVMGIAMAGLLASGLRVLPRGEWEGVFAVLTAWFVVWVVRDSVAHGFPVSARENRVMLAQCAAMLYLYLALTTTAGGGTEMAGMATPSSGPAALSVKYPNVAFIFGLVLIGYTVWALDQVSVRGSGRTGAGIALGVRGFLLSAEMTVCCLIVLAATMAFTLFSLTTRTLLRRERTELMPCHRLPG